jgi:hypothetical protein
MQISGRVESVVIWGRRGGKPPTRIFIDGNLHFKSSAAAVGFVAWSLPRVRTVNIDN